MSDTSPDRIKFSASAVIARRHIWLKSWNVDSLSKSHMASWPFLDGKLFGDSLKDILKETKVKKKGMLFTYKREGRWHRNSGL